MFIELDFASAIRKIFNIWGLVKNLIFVTCNMFDMLHVTQVTCDIFNMIIDLDFPSSFQKYITHGVFGKILCILIFVTCTMCDMCHVTHVTYDIFNIIIELDFPSAFQKYITHGVFCKIFSCSYCYLATH